MIGSIGDSVDLASLGLSPPAPKRKEELGQEDFLNLMITQLKNQDPFKPLESGEFLGQLAQFGTVSGLAELKTSFEALASSLVSNQALQAAMLVGRSVLAPSARAALEGEGAVAGAVELPENASAVRVEIRDANGQVVRRLDLGRHEAGLVEFEWDGVTDTGERAAPGAYALVASYQVGNETIGADTFVAARVESVLFGANGLTVQLRGLGDVPFSTVREIRGE